MRTRILLVVIATTAAFATSASQADALTPEQVADAAWPNSPCHGQTIADIPKVGITASDTGQTLAGAASGLATDETGVPEVPFRAVRCETTTDPIVYAAMTAAEKCQYRVHEAGHLAGFQHTASGPMVADPEARWYGPCHTLRERVRHDIEAMVPLGAQVACGRWQGRSFTCITDYADARGRSFMRAYRVRTRGDAYAIRRIRGPRWLRLQAA